MNLINRDTDYALRAIIFIAQSDKELVSTAELEEELKLPRPFLRKILQILQKEGILNSVKGVGGGFNLAKPIEKIFLLDLIKIFQGPLTLAECMFRNKVCKNRKTCPLHKKIKALEQYARDYMKDVTIGTLLKG
ncbi:MAG TPA: Rrf2 family transcriptional regulator [Candidatus Omnitrophota bacterium]|nr:Rrf2 family transcriptional regulator [Candidatus Omnitrophota bacterium]